MAAHPQSPRCCLGIRVIGPGEVVGSSPTGAHLCCNEGVIGEEDEFSLSDPYLRFRSSMSKRNFLRPPARLGPLCCRRALVYSKEKSQSKPSCSRILKQEDLQTNPRLGGWFKITKEQPRENHLSEGPRNISPHTFPICTRGLVPYTSTRVGDGDSMKEFGDVVN